MKSVVEACVLYLCRNLTVFVCLWGGGGRQFLGFCSPMIIRRTAVILLDRTRWRAGLDRWLSDSTFYHAPINAHSKGHTDCGLEWYKWRYFSARLWFRGVVSMVWCQPQNLQQIRSNKNTSFHLHAHVCM